MPQAWKSVLTGERVTAIRVGDRASLRLSDLFSRFPVAFLENE
jgi:hypothetical protein